MPVLRILRLGLRQFAAGMLSVLTLGVLNRVMKVELGVNLTLVSLVIGAHYFAAIVAIPLGYRSDKQPWRGYHRVPYIAVGTAITSLTTALAPFAALLVAKQGGSIIAAGAGVVLFLLMGVGMYLTGTAYLSLITDLTSEEERSRAIAITWAMMMIGILAGVFLSTQVMNYYSPQRLVFLFLGVSGLVAALTTVAVWGQERPRTARPSQGSLTLRQALRLLTGSRQARFFFAFLFGGMFFLFVQQMTLEPFGGEVFSLNVKQTTLFNAYQMVGVLLGMGMTGGWLARRVGKKVATGVGLVASAIAFVLLGLSSIGEHVALVRPAIFVTGLGMGIFTVGGLSLMMDLTVKERVGLFMGAWTLAQALANGLASLGGGVLHDLGLALLGAEAGAYGLVFLFEAGGLVGMMALLLGLDEAKFRAEVDGLLWHLLGEAT